MDKLKSVGFLMYLFLLLALMTNTIKKNSPLCCLLTKLRSRISWSFLGGGKNQLPVSIPTPWASCDNLSQQAGCGRLWLVPLCSVASGSPAVLLDWPWVLLCSGNAPHCLQMLPIALRKVTNRGLREVLEWSSDFLIYSFVFQPIVQMLKRKCNIRGAGASKHTHKENFCSQNMTAPEVCYHKYQSIRTLNSEEGETYKPSKHSRSM